MVSIPSNKAKSTVSTDLFIPAVFAVLKLLFHLPVLTRYGYHQDELYFIACGEHLSFGYVDHAPLVPWLARLATTLFGDSLFGLRILATLAGAAAIWITILLVRRLGGGRFAQVMAGIAMLIAPVWLRTSNMLCLPAFEPLFWVGAAYLLVRMIQESNPRYWPGIGLVCGIGLINKHSMLFFGLGLFVALLATPLRRSFRSPWLYVGGAIAVACLLPNLIWQYQNDWATLGFLINLNEGVMSGISLLQFLAGQLLYLHPLNAVLWVWGLLFFLRSPSARSYRALGWIWLTVFVVLVVTRSKIYYLAPAYPMLLAGGAVAMADCIKRSGRTWLKTAAPIVWIALGLILLPLSVPVLDIDTTERYVHNITFHSFENIFELTGDLRSMFGWRERVDAVSQVYHALSPEEQSRTVIFAAGYGNAGAIDLFGPEYQLPEAVSLSMTYWLWRDRNQPADIIITAGFGHETLERIFDDVRMAADVELENVNPWQTPFSVAVCRNPKISLDQLWEKNRPW